MRTYSGKLVAALLIFLAYPQLGAAATEKLQPFEIGAAMVQLGRVRMLAHRISKQNLLVQLMLDDGARQGMADTAHELDATLASLIEGGVLMAVPEPPTVAVRRQLVRVDAAFGAVRAMALASPFDYVRRSGARREIYDPLLIRYFDDLAMAVNDNAKQAVRLYTEICIDAGIRSIVDTSAQAICTLMATATETSMLSEKVSKEMVFALAEVDTEENLASLKQTRTRFEHALSTALESTLIQAAMSPDRGIEGKVVHDIGRGIEAAWAELIPAVDRVIAGEGEAVDLPDALETQYELVWGLQRLSVAVERFAAHRRVVRRRAAMQRQ